MRGLSLSSKDETAADLRTLETWLISNQNKARKERTTCYSSEQCCDKTIANLNRQLWNESESEVRSPAICKRIKYNLSTLNPKALEYIPGAFRHGLVTELELNYPVDHPKTSGPNERKHTNPIDLTPKKLKSSDADYIEWNSEDSRPELELHVLNDIEESLSRYEFGPVYRDVRVAQELFNRGEIDIEQITPRNARLRLTRLRKLLFRIDNNERPMAAFLINPLEMDLVLGLPWLCKTRVVLDYDDMEKIGLVIRNATVSLPWKTWKTREKTAINRDAGGEAKGSSIGEGKERFDKEKMGKNF
ncbi:hypothetical protein MJO28_013991 [Puccinia striiformis f. sp. tritici]|uniref:Uncharacterized protein n=1 Tax=Puccinia striiformis f. sp. tritici TaxID=168172 RepID=A0ACC0DVW5_9BASI|nr:hypothetical protein MJO28_013991 [Puccinia striiformis f. sp. tritici]